MDRSCPADRDHIGSVYRPRNDAWPHRAQTRASLGGGDQGRWLGDADLRLRILAAGFDLGLCRRTGQAGARAMIVVMLATYMAILALFVWLRFIPFNMFWKISPLIVLLVLNIGLFIP